MFKKIISQILLALFIATSIAPSAFAQTTGFVEDELPLFYTDIESQNFAEVNSPIIFTAKPQFDTEAFENVRYKWTFSDGNRDTGKQVAHTFVETGAYTVDLTVNIDGVDYVQDPREVFVAIKAALLLTDKDNEKAKIRSILSLAQEENVFIKTIESFSSQSQFLSEEVLARKLEGQKEIIDKIETIIVWTDGGSGLNALSRYQQKQKDKNVFANTSIILLTEDFSNLRRVKRQYNQLQPKEILMIQESGIFQYFEDPSIQTFKDRLDKSGFDYQIVNKQKNRLTPFNILSFFLDFLTEQGIPDNTLILVLLLPLIATTIAFMKQVIGITTLGIYTPTIITLTFLILGLKFGIVILFFLVAMGTIAHKLVKPLKLLYIPKMALIITSVAIIIFLLLTLTVYLNLFDIEFISLAIFPVVIMGTLTEKFVSIRSEKGLSLSLIMMIETFFVALVAYFLAGGAIDLYFFEIQWTYLQDLVLNTPEIVVLFILINIYLGRWTGLRLTEYLQFRDVIKDIQE